MAVDPYIIGESFSLIIFMPIINYRIYALTIIINASYIKRQIVSHIQTDFSCDTEDRRHTILFSRMTWIYLCLVFLTMTVMWKIIGSKKRKPRAPDKRLPGPRQYPFIGNMFMFLSPNFALLAHDLIKKYGPIYKLNNSKSDYIVVGNQALVKEVLIKQGRVFSGRPDALVTGLLKSSSDEIEPFSKTIMTKTLAPFASVMKINSFTSDITTRLLQHFKNQDEGAFCPFDAIHDYSAGVIANLLIGEKGEKIVNKLSDLTKTVESATLPHRQALVELLPWLKKLRSSNASRINTLVKEIYAICEKEGKAALSDASLRCLMQVLFRENKKKNDVSKQDYQAQKIMTFVMFGGTSTISSFLQKTLAVMAHYPTIQEQVHNELDSVLGDRQAEINDMAKCPYTMATVQEVLRNCILAVAKAPHVVLEDTTLAGYDIPAGTRVLIHTWAAHHDPEAWDDPYLYKPERFLDSNGQFLPVDHPTRRQLMPFNSGPKICPGKTFANARLFCTICTVLQKFKIKPESKVDPSFVDPRTLENDMKIKIRFCARNKLS